MHICIHFLHNLQSHYYFNRVNSCNHQLLYRFVHTDQSKTDPNQSKPTIDKFYPCLILDPHFVRISPRVSVCGQLRYR